MRLLLMARPKDGDALNLLGVIGLQRGDYAAATNALTRAAAAQPRNPGVHFNLGNACLQSNQLEAAVEHYDTATRLRPGYADAEALKADALRKLERWPQAALAYRNALQGNKDHFVALNGYGLCLMREGDATRAVDMLSAALERVPPQDKPGRAGVLANLGGALLQAGAGVDGLTALTEAAVLLPQSDEIAYLLAQSLQHVRAVPKGEAFSGVLLRLLERDDINPRALSSACVATLRSEPRQWAVLQTLGQSSPGNIADESLEALSGNRLLATMLTKAPIPDPNIELALTNLRRHLLLSLADADRRPHLAFICALAQQCHLNEYVYGVTAEEDDAVASLMEASHCSSANPNWAGLALIACYRPLDRLDDGAVTRAGAPEGMAALFRQQIDETAEERAYAAAIEALTPVTDAVSQAVRTQYEENPYPRWMGVSRRAPRPFRDAVRDILPHLDEARLPLTDTPRVLVAGCGTGLETMRVVGSYQTASVLAVDLSRASLAYGALKLAEYGISGVEHRQADILELDGLDRRFDLIGSFGVIHHMAEPQRGLAVLAGLLDPGGVLSVGLYSAIARQPVTRVRALIAERGVPPTPVGISGLRRDIMRGEADPELSILASPASDFWTMSECRDLMFHVEEHQFTLLQIEEMFGATGLEFLGMEIPHAPDLTLFRQENPSASALSSLPAWHRFEQAHPQMFGGTYHLWARKPA